MMQRKKRYELQVLALRKAVRLTVADFQDRVGHLIIPPHEVCFALQADAERIGWRKPTASELLAVDMFITAPKKYGVTGFNLSVELSALDEAITNAGSQAALARDIGVSQQLISYWLKKGGVVPAEYVVKVESASGVSRHALRPDIFGHATAPPGDQSLMAVAS